MSPIWARPAIALILREGWNWKFAPHSHLHTNAWSFSETWSAAWGRGAGGGSSRGVCTPHREGLQIWGLEGSPSLLCLRASTTAARRARPRPGCGMPRRGLASLGRRGRGQWRRRGARGGRPRAPFSLNLPALRAVHRSSFRPWNAQMTHPTSASAQTAVIQEDKGRESVGVPLSLNGESGRRRDRRPKQPQSGQHSARWILATVRSERYSGAILLLSPHTRPLPLRLHESLIRVDYS